MSVGKHVFCIYRNTENKINCKKTRTICSRFLKARGGVEPLLCAKYIVNTRASHHLFLKSKQK